MQQKHHVQYDNHKEDKFIVAVDKKNLEFISSENGLYFNKKGIVNNLVLLRLLMKTGNFIQKDNLKEQK